MLDLWQTYSGPVLMTVAIVYIIIGGVWLVLNCISFFFA